MKPEIFRNIMHRLLEIEANDSPLISCFINLDASENQGVEEALNRLSELSKRLGGQRKHDFDDAVEEISRYLREEIKPRSKGVAIYARWGDAPVFLTLQFEVPTPTLVIVDALPHVYPLVELRDTYHRFVTVVTTEQEARILETAVGSVTEEILTQRPDLRERVGREWTKEHYHNHRSDRDQKFIKEKIRIIDDLVNRGKHGHLIIAGTPQMVGRMMKALPKRLSEKVISSLVVNPGNDISAILMEAIHLFTAAEDLESREAVQQLEAEVLRGGLGVAGYDASFEALQQGYASTLIIDQHDEEQELREALVRLAVESGVPVETVNGDEPLRRMGGVGCLLRYRPLFAEDLNLAPKAA